MEKCISKNSWGEVPTEVLQSFISHVWIVWWMFVRCFIGCELFSGFGGVWAAPRAMGLPGLRGPLQSSSLQVNIEITLIACKPEKSGVCPNRVLKSKALSKAFSICSCLHKWGTFWRHMMICHGGLQMAKTRFSWKDQIFFSHCALHMLWGCLLCWDTVGKRCLGGTLAVCPWRRLWWHLHDLLRASGPLSSCASWVCASKDCISCLVQTC